MFSIYKILLYLLNLQLFSQVAMGAMLQKDTEMLEFDVIKESFQVDVYS